MAQQHGRRELNYLDPIPVITRRLWQLKKGGNAVDESIASYAAGATMMAAARQNHHAEHSAQSERNLAMNKLIPPTFAQLLWAAALTATMSSTSFAAGTGNKARTDVEIKKSAIVNVATGQGSTASTEIGSVTQTNQSQSEARTRVRMDTTAVINVATGKNSKATTQIGTVRQD